MGDAPPEDPPNKTDGYLKRFATAVLSPFVNSSRNQVESYRGIGKSVDSVDDPNRLTFLRIHADNFTLGAAWGIVSGYTSRDFFRRVPDKFKLLKFLGYTKKFSKFNFIKKLRERELLYPTFVTARIIRRAIGAGVVFDVAESKVAQKLNSGKSSTLSTVAGLSILAVAFRVTNNFRDTAIASSVILGGYVAGSQLAKFIRKWKKRDSD